MKRSYSGKTIDGMNRFGHRFHCAKTQLLSSLILHWYCRQLICFDVMGHTIEWSVYRKNMNLFRTRSVGRKHILFVQVYYTIWWLEYLMKLGHGTEYRHRSICISNDEIVIRLNYGINWFWHQFLCAKRQLLSSLLLHNWYLPTMFQCDGSHHWWRSCLYRKTKWNL